MLAKIDNDPLNEELESLRSTLHGLFALAEIHREAAMHGDVPSGDCVVPVIVDRGHARSTILAAIDKFSEVGLSQSSIWDRSRFVDSLGADLGGRFTQLLPRCDKLSTAVGLMKACSCYAEPLKILDAIIAKIFSTKGGEYITGPVTAMMAESALSRLQGVHGPNAFLPESHEIEVNISYGRTQRNGQALPGDSLTSSRTRRAIHRRLSLEAWEES